MPKESLVLLIDDDPSFCEILSLKLSTLGIKVAVASDGASGVQKAKTLKPDLVLMDMKMPGMDGAEATMKLREDPRTKDLKVVFITQFGAYGKEGEEVDRHFALSSGAAGYLRKSEDLDKMAEQINAFLKT